MSKDNKEKDTVATQKKRNPKIVVVIPAKRESRRLTNKNVCLVGGIPMLTWALRACNQSKYKLETWVSSNSMDILKIAKEYGAIPYRRDVELCLDYVEKFLVIKDVALYIDKIYKPEEKPDIVISLQPNSPEIETKHLDAAIDYFIECGRDEIFSVNDDLLQNGAFSIMKWDYVLRQETVSTKCGVFVCNLTDIHTVKDVESVHNKMSTEVMSTEVDGSEFTSTSIYF